MLGVRFQKQVFEVRKKNEKKRLNCRFGYKNGNIFFFFKKRGLAQGEVFFKLQPKSVQINVLQVVWNQPDSKNKSLKYEKKTEI